MIDLKAEIDMRKALRHAKRQDQKHKRAAAAAS
jgi:hypothetical protein